MTTSVTGLKVGGAAANTTVLTMAFTSLTNALVESDTLATSGAVTTKNAEAFITVSNFGFNSLIPYGAIIDKVGLRHRGTATTGAAAHEASLLIGATQGAVSSANNVALTTVFVENYARPGGGKWTRADLLNASLTARLRSLHPNNTTSRTYDWAWVEVLVTFQDPTEDFPTPEWDLAGEFVAPVSQFILVNTALGAR